MSVPYEQIEWRICPMIPKYECSNLGQFRNAQTLHPLKKHFYPRTGYGFIRVRHGGWYRTLRSAPVIARTWLGDPPAGKPHVDHLDGDKTNERVTNLEWVDASTNVSRAFANGQHENRPGNTHFHSEETYAEVMRLWAEGTSQLRIARLLNARGIPIGNSSVSRIVNGLTTCRAAKTRL